MLKITGLEQKTDFEKLNINIVTDGSINPKEESQKLKILIQHFMLFSDEKINFDTEDDNEFDEDSLHMVNY